MEFKKKTLINPELTHEEANILTQAFNLLSSITTSAGDGTIVLVGADNAEVCTIADVEKVAQHLGPIAAALTPVSTGD